MALFGKNDVLAAQIRRLQEEANLAPNEIDELLVLVTANRDFRFEDHLWMLGHSSPKVRECARHLFVARRDPALADIVIRSMVGQPGAARQHIAKLVAHATPQRMAARLGALVQSKKIEEREAALDLIAQSPRWQDLLGHLKTLLHDPVERLRQNVVRVLSRGVDNPTVFMILRNLIHDDDRLVRRLIIEAFAARPTADIIEPFFERLPEETSEVRTSMIRALSQLARSSQSKVEERLLPLLGDENPETREAAVRLLREMPDQAAVLRTFLIYSRGLVFWLRERSLESILKISDDIIEPLVKLMQDPDDDIRVGAMMMARGANDPRIVPHVRDIFLSGADWWVRGMAAEVLARFPGGELTDLLVSHLSDPDLRYTIISVLGKQGSPKAVKALLGCLGDPQPGIRRCVLDAVKGVRSEEVMRAISRLAKSDADEETRERATEILLGFGTLSTAVLNEVSAVRQEAEKKEEAPLELQMVNEALNH